MSATGKKLKFVSALGADNRWKPELGGADDIVNARVDPEGLGWLFDRGIEPWWNPGTSFSVTGNATTLTDYLDSAIDSCYVWTKQNSEQTYVIIEQAGNLYYWLGNKGASTGNYYFNDLFVIDSGRHIPSTNEPGTQYIPYGNRLLIVNGYDKPIWFYGREKSRNFSFTMPTASPEVLSIDTSYLSASELEQGIVSPTFTSISNYGLGQIDVRNHFEWKITFITDSGSESPLSSLAVVDWFNAATAAERVKVGVFIKELPVGPDGTVARRIYRTKNQKTSTVAGASDAIYYFVKQINENVSKNFTDIIPDGMLVDNAPTQSDSVVISGAYQYGANWNNRIWLAGGTPHPTRIIYSEAGLPEQFPAGNYFELGNSAGGAITAIYPYYNNLIVFRQRSIELIRVNQTGFSIGQLSPEIGTEATNTIKFVPGYGVMFLSYDNVYVINGGTDGGSVVNLNKISTKIGKELERLNKSALQRATAVYSNKEREYWIHYPVDGNNYNSRGVVFHTDNGHWSYRHAVDDNDHLFRFASMTVDPDGNILLGPKPTWLKLSVASGELELSSPSVAGAVGKLPGFLHVWSGAYYWGKQLTVTSFNQDIAAYTVANIALPTRRWESSWIDFGDNSAKHRVFSVEVEILSQGNTELELSWTQDYDYSFTSAGLQKMNKPETVNTTFEDPVFGPTSTDAKNFFTTGTSILQDGRVTTLRWDVSTKLVQNFKFRLDSEDAVPFHIVSFHVDFNDGSNKTLNQIARGSTSQPY